MKEYFVCVFTWFGRTDHTEEDEITFFPSAMGLELAQERAKALNYKIQESPAGTWKPVRARVVYEDIGVNHD